MIVKSRSGFGFANAHLSLGKQIIEFSRYGKGIVLELLGYRKVAMTLCNTGYLPCERPLTQKGDLLADAELGCAHPHPNILDNSRPFLLDIDFPFTSFLHTIVTRDLDDRPIEPLFNL